MTGLYVAAGIMLLCVLLVLLWCYVQVRARAYRPAPCHHGYDDWDECPDCSRFRKS